MMRGVFREKTSCDTLLMDGECYMPAEWAPHSRCWMAWPCRAEAFGGEGGLMRARRAYGDIARAITAFEPVTMVARPQDANEVAAMLGDGVAVRAMPIDDSWARDTGPSFLIGAGLAAVQWRFNAWGGKYAPYDADATLATRIAAIAGAEIRHAPLACEGGAIHCDGEGTVLATEQTLLNPNRNPGMTREGVERIVCNMLGARKLLWIGDGFSDLETDGHIDNIACFVAPGKVLVGRPAFFSDPDWESVEAAIRTLRAARDANGRALDIIEIEQPQAVANDWRGQKPAASYVNFYMANGAIVMPGFDDPADEAALRVLRDCFPARKIVQLDARAVIEGGGGIHCITCQEPSLCAA